MGQKTTGRSLKTIDKTVAIVEALQENDGGGVTEIAHRLGFSPATVYNHLSTLKKHRFVVQEGDEYRLGLRFLNVGGYARDQYNVLSLVEPKLEEIAAETTERAQFLLEEHGRAIVVSKETSPNAVVADTVVGKTSFMHASAAGKAMLSAMTDTRVDEIVDRWGLPGQTENTITDRAELFRKLEEIRSAGYAFNDEESISGLRSVGVPVLDRDDTVLGALSVSGPAHRMEGSRYHDEIPKMLLGAVNEIELKNAYK
jgi:IclR family acetate operon transcriptional repressor